MKINKDLQGDKEIPCVFIYMLLNDENNDFVYFYEFKLVEISE